MYVRRITSTRLEEKLNRYFLAVLVSFILIQPAYSQNSLGNRLAAAERYANTFDIQYQLDWTLVAMTENMPAAQRTDFMRFMRNTVDFNRLRNIMINMMVQVFDVDELNALADFYGSWKGRSILRKYPEFAAAYQPVLDQEIERIAEQYPKSMQKPQSRQPSQQLKPEDLLKDLLKELGGG